MMATYKDGHFFCEEHGDLGEHDEAIPKARTRSRARSSDPRGCGE